MQSNVLLSALLGLSLASTGVLAWLHFGTPPDARERALRQEIETLEGRVRDLSSRAVRDADAGAALSEAEKRLDALRMADLESSSRDLSSLIDDLDRACQRARDAVGVDHEGEIIARHYIRLAIERIRALGPAAAPALLERLSYRDDENRALHSSTRRQLLEALAEVDPNRAVEFARDLFRTRGEGTDLRLHAAHVLKGLDAPLALEVAQEVLDEQRGRPAISFQNLAELVGLVGELGSLLGTEKVAPILRDLTLRPDWDPSARIRAISWIVTLGLREAFDDLERIVRQPGNDHYLRLRALQAMRDLDPARTLPVLDWIVYETNVDPGFKSNLEAMAAQIRQAQAAGGTGAGDPGKTPDTGDGGR